MKIEAPHKEYVVMWKPIQFTVPPFTIYYENEEHNRICDTKKRWQNRKIIRT